MPQWFQAGKAVWMLQGGFEKRDCVVPISEIRGTMSDLERARGWKRNLLQARRSRYCVDGRKGPSRLGVSDCWAAGGDVILGKNKERGDLASDSALLGDWGIVTFVCMACTKQSVYRPPNDVWGAWCRRAGVVGLPFLLK